MYNFDGYLLHIGAYIWQGAFYNVQDTRIDRTTYKHETIHTECLIDTTKQAGDNHAVAVIELKGLVRAIKAGKAK